MAEEAVSSSPGSSAVTAVAAYPYPYRVARSLHGALVVRDELPYSYPAAAAAAPPPPAQVQQGSSGGGGGKISPAVLFIIVILAVVFFISGLLHLLVRLLMKKQHRRRGGSAAAAAQGPGEADAALQRQLQQLFHLHDSGLDQAFIDALPVFSYREIVVGGGGGDKEPFDCAVCLCEFDAEDRLRLLPLCGHAFHLNCIDTWLLSNSTCPLCRGVLFAPGLTAENNPMFDFDEGLEEGRLSECCEDGFGLPTQKSSEGLQEPAAEKRVFPVRLGKFKNVGTQGAVEGGNADSAVLRREEGESSSSSLRNRSSARCCSSLSSWPGRKEGKGSGGDQAMAAPLEFLEAQGSTRPELAEWYAALADLYQRKLWHQLTLKLDQFLALAVVQAGDALIQLYTHFISDFESKINLLKFAHFAVVVSRQYSDKDAGISYLEGVISKLHDTKESRIEEPVLYVKMQIASFLLEKGNQKECKKLVDEGKTTLDSMDDVDPSVHSTYYWLCSQYHKVCQDYSEFYKNALLYLAYTTVESLSEPFKQNLAFDLSLAALLGDNIYNFGELLAHPIIHSLVGTSVEWIYHILQAFNSGNLASYQELCKVHATALSAQPALVQKERELLEKINVLCLMEIIFSRASQDRTIPLSTIAEQTRLSVEDVEYLLMKSLSAHLIEGIIDGVDGTVHVSWAQPRVLGIDQVKSLRDRLDTWVGKVHTTLLSVEAETPDLVAS